MVNHSKLFLALSFFLVIVVLTSLTACQDANSQNSLDVNTLNVTVSILPQAFFVESIGGKAVEVNVMVGPGEEAHTYEPSPDQMKSLSTSQIFFTIGVEYETLWVPRFQNINPEMIIVDSIKGITRQISSEVHTHESQDDEDENVLNSEHFDPHVWLAPDNGKIIAQNILTALSELSPQNAQTFNDNYMRLLADIDELDTRIETTLKGIDQRKFMVFHPAWAYFAKQFGLEQISVQIGGQDPSAKEMVEIIRIAREEKIHVIFVQPTFSTADAEAIAREIGAQIAVIDPLARNWIENLERVADSFAASLIN
ncbi:MAG: metal ABC transporter solute-binding protein, Zn/Mn family [Anaerolineales bacterium]